MRKKHVSIIYGIERVNTTKANEYSLRFTQWLVFSGSRLRVGELSEVVAIYLQRDPFFDRSEVLEHPGDVFDIYY